MAIVELLQAHLVLIMGDFLLGLVTLFALRCHPSRAGSKSSLL